VNLMRILFLTPQLPYPPHQGTAMRNYGLIRGLSERHYVSLLSFSESSRAGADVAGPLSELCQRVETVPVPPPRSALWRGFDTFTHRLPDMALRLASSGFAERLAAWLARESFDVVHVEGIEMTPYLGLLLGDSSWVQAYAGKEFQTHFVKQQRSKLCSPLVVFDDHNCEYMLQKRYAQVDARTPRRWAGALYSLVQWQKLRFYEAAVCRRAHHVLAVSQTDAEALQRLVPDLNVTVIPNGIDVDLYEAVLQDGVPESRSSQPPTVVFVGKMDFRPNVDAVRWFAEAIWPRVRLEVPEAHFFIVGQRPHAQLDYLRAEPSMTLTGWVDEVHPYIANATVFVMPLRMGSGSRLKLLEAMALGAAIVSTRIGAEGFTDVGSEHLAAGARVSDSADGHVVDDRELVLVDDNDPKAFALAVIALLRDPTRRARLGAAGRAFVEKHYDWRVIVPQLEALYIHH
jgi:glycosyltransferase involved in cell wall biosynthesis